MPWELWLADGFRQMPNVAVFPGVDTANDYKWSEREYLGVYDRIVYGAHQAHAKPIFMVYNHENNTGTELAAWLRS